LLGSLSIKKLSPVSACVGVNVNRMSEMVWISTPANETKLMSFTVPFVGLYVIYELIDAIRLELLSKIEIEKVFVSST
jgi:hypothetical protein